MNTLGLPADEMPFYDPKYKKAAEKVLELIMLEGNFGKENMKGYKRRRDMLRVSGILSRNDLAEISAC